MKIWQRLGIATLCLGMVVVAHAGDAQRGQGLAATCAACHGADGNSVNPQWPKLAGQHASYIAASLAHYQSGARPNVLMTGQAAGLSEQDMRDLGAYYATLTVRSGQADPALVDLGREIYTRGLADQGVPACSACHGPAGQGMASAVFPMLHGQHAVYTAMQLRAYRSGERATDPARMMRSVAELLSDAEIEAVASYIEGLEPAR
jgi:cytochrome c553